MGKMGELAYEKEQEEKRNFKYCETYIEWSMTYANTPEKYTPSYENWYNKKYGGGK